MSDEGICNVQATCNLVSWCYVWQHSFVNVWGFKAIIGKMCMSKVAAVQRCAGTEIWTTLSNELLRRKT